MWIKICGNTNLADVQASIDAGADAVGYVFAESRRKVTAEQVAAITPGLPEDLTQIGVFESANFDEIAASVRASGIHGAQLHGSFDLELLENLRNAFEPPFFLVQTLHWDLTSDPEELETRLRDQLRALVRHGVADAVLIDAKTATASGGTGQPVDWSRARQALAPEAGKLRVILAGGLNSTNVEQAIRTLQPWGVDVSSGVEAKPGRKDPSRVREFIRAARLAFAAIEDHPITPAMPR